MHLNCMEVDPKIVENISKNEIDYYYFLIHRKRNLKSIDSDNLISVVAMNQILSKLI